MFIKSIGKLLVLILMLQFANMVAAETYNSIWSTKVNREFYYINGDRISLGVIKFKADDWQDKNYINSQVSNAQKMNYQWDDKWYYATLSESSNEVIVLFFKNHDTNTQGWVAIKNTPDVWYYMTNYGDVKTLRGEGDPDGKVNNFWNVFGNRNDGMGSLSIDIMNPVNGGGITSKEILVSFGK